MIIIIVTYIYNKTLGIREKKYTEINQSYIFINKLIIKYIMNKCLKCFIVTIMLFQTYIDFLQRFKETSGHFFRGRHNNFIFLALRRSMINHNIYNFLGGQSILCPP